MAFELSRIVIVAVWPFTAALPAVAVPEMVTPAAASLLLMMLSPAIGVVIAMVGAVVARVKITGVLLPVLPATSVSWATMLLVPLPDSDTLALQLPPPLPIVAVPICDVTPFTVSNSVTVLPTAASPAMTLPEIVCVAWLVVVPAVLIATVGAIVSNAIVWLAVVAALPAASVTLALML